MARDEDLDLLKAIRLCAFGSVKDKDTDYLLRFIFRWYSEKFHTPLHVVDELPIENVLTAFFECRYEDMEDEKLEEEEANLRETRVERIARELEEKLREEEDDEFYQQVKAESKAEMAEIRTRLDEPVDPDIGRPLFLPIMGEKLPQTFQDVADKMDPKLKEVPPAIEMKFVTEEELGNLDEWDILGPPPTKK